jgi:transcriptional regulator with XRE-family HTH domain
MAMDVKLDTRLIRKLREDKGWSQEHLAAVSGLSARTIQRLETEGNASLESRSALAAAFGVAPSALGAAAASAAEDKRRSPIADAAVARPSSDPVGIVRLIVLVVMFLGAAGYLMGRDMARRDNAREADCTAAPAGCGATAGQAPQP